MNDLAALWKVNVSRTGVDSDSEDAATFATIFKQIAPKLEAGFNVNAMDLVERTIAYEYVPGPRRTRFNLVKHRSTRQSQEFFWPDAHCAGQQY